MNNGRFSVGEPVYHKGYGYGRIITEWGTFYTCRYCIRPLPSADTMCCGKSANVIAGSNIFDVQFQDGKTRSINRIWLMKLGRKHEYKRAA
jgi:hypothetical protein